MASATFRHGDPLMIDHTPASGNVTAGDVVLLGNTAGLTCGIAHVDIPNGTKGALAAGGGVYEAVMLQNIAAYSKVFWDATNTKLTNTSTNNAKVGFLITGGTGVNTTVKFRHDPTVD